MAIYSVITGTGSYISDRVRKNEEFYNLQEKDPPKYQFLDGNGDPIKNKDGTIKSNEQVVQKFEETTGIEERRYVPDDYVASKIAVVALKNALDSSKIDPESLDGIFLAHNFGDIKIDNRRSDFVPDLAARVKHELRIKNPKTIAFDINFGCPGWLEQMILADRTIKVGAAKRIAVVGTETLSKVCDWRDMDSMIYGDGAGAVVVEAKESEKPVGILSYAERCDTYDEAYYLWMGRSNNPNYKGDELFLKMQGNKVFEYAIRNVPGVVKESLDKVGFGLEDVSKILMHQANDKLDKKILTWLYKLYGKKEADVNWDILPMTISWLGNSSVATIPTLLDLILKGKEEKINHHKLSPNDIIVFASVGAGMGINSVVYKMTEEGLEFPRDYKKAA